MFVFLHYITCGCFQKKQNVYKISYNQLPKLDTNTLPSFVINKTTYNSAVIPTTTTVYF